MTLALKAWFPLSALFELDVKVTQCLKETDRMLTRGISEGQLQLFKETAAQMLRNLDD